MNIQLPPKPIIYAIIIVTSFALIPPALIYRARTVPSDLPRIHYIQDMDNQPRYKSQQANDLFVDGRANRPQIEGTVARDEARLDEHYWKGWADGDWAATWPARLTVDQAFLERGRERFDIFCSMCHGPAGYGDGPVHQRAMMLVNNPVIGNGTEWVQPKNIHEPLIVAQPIGQVYNTITNGIRNMAGYAAQIPVADRWAITAYVQALQLSQAADPSNLVGVDLDTLPLLDLRPAMDEDAAASDASAAALPAAGTLDGAAS